MHTGRGFGTQMLYDLFAYGTAIGDLSSQFGDGAVAAGEGSVDFELIFMFAEPVFAASAAFFRFDGGGRAYRQVVFVCGGRSCGGCSGGDVDGCHWMCLEEGPASFFAPSS